MLYIFKQVLVQGWLINNRNFNEFIKTIMSEMNRLENALAATLSNRKTQVHLIFFIYLFNTFNFDIFLLYIFIGFSFIISNDLLEMK